VSDWFAIVVPLFKGVHIAGLMLWCGGLLALPLMLSRHDPAATRDEYRRLRRATHVTYAGIVTPAAVVAVVAGTWLIFFRELYVPWLYAKLHFVAALVAGHAWVGHMVVRVAEAPDRPGTSMPYLTIAAIAVPVLAILILVLGKPDLGGMPLPAWLHEPRGGQLLLDVPRR